MKAYRISLLVELVDVLAAAQQSAEFAVTIPDLVISVADVLKKKAPNVTVSDAITKLHEANFRAALAQGATGPLKEMSTRLMDVAARSAQDLGLPERIRKRAQRVGAAIKDQRVDATAISVMVSEFIEDIKAELDEPLFLHIKTRNRELFEQNAPLFGAAVEAKFAVAQRDIRAAGRCLALEEWTACVFHLMRALEPALHALATKVNVAFPTSLDFENWKNIVDKVDAEIARQTKALEQTTKSHQRNAELRALGEASIQMRHFKNAWRNDAAHGREHYDEREATLVYEAVRDFMQQMASVV